MSEQKNLSKLANMEERQGKELHLEMQQTISPEGLSIPVKIGVDMLAMRSYLSTHHLRSARHLVTHAKEIEDSYKDRSELTVEYHRAYVLGAILCGVAFFDSAINELYQDALDNHESYIKSLDVKAINELKIVRQRENRFRGLGPLKKYQKALECIVQQKFNEEDSLFENAKLAITVRNDLMHFKPKTVSSANETDIENLKEKFTEDYLPNKLMGDTNNPYFPDRFLGFGGAGWVVDSLKAFADEFFERINVIPNYRILVDGISTD